MITGGRSLHGMKYEPTSSVGRVIREYPRHRDVCYRPYKVEYDNEGYGFVHFYRSSIGARLSVFWHLHILLRGCSAVLLSQRFN